MFTEWWKAEGLMLTVKLTHDILSFHIPGKLTNVGERSEIQS